ncbi:GHMP kinase family protein [Striga hermonthica]|uniref:phosphomevalonate kinase n=1 Tax=Striga hermonthica TaxID=68872 RepID=A0A9N7RDZ0_STRHE|nr:GHMP kinase family protein [Striga hermonthica]
MAVVASAPGKVLMTGGYLILERPNAGIVLSTNARFYAIVKPLYEDLKPDTAAHATFDNTKKEELHKLLLLGLDITILGCNEFYSYKNQTHMGTLTQIEACGLPLSPDSLASLPPFTSITFNAEESSEQKSKPEVAKTGLGSSAAMTTAVVAALLHYLGVVKLSLENSSLPGDQVSKELDVVHIIAQTAHCIAQGKVGSGFDVSSAVYESQKYIRFSPEVLSSAQDVARGLSIQEVIGDVLKANWDHKRTNFQLPPMMSLLHLVQSSLTNVLC